MSLQESTGFNNQYTLSKSRDTTYRCRDTDSNVSHCPVEISILGSSVEQVDPRLLVGVVGSLCKYNVEVLRSH